MRLASQLADRLEALVGDMAVVRCNELRAAELALVQACGTKMVLL